MVQTFILRSDRDRYFAVRAVERASAGLAVVIDHPKRTTEQNRRLWSMLQAIADSDTTFDGDQLDAEEWKDVLGSAWLKMKGRETGRLRKGLEGEPVVLGRFSSSKLNTKDFAEFTTSVLAFIDTRGIHWAEREQPPAAEDYR
jgi:hypothetical protein